MKSFVVDASAAIKWYIPEPLSEQAVTYLELLQQGRAVLLSPDLVIAEMGNVLWKKVGRGELTPEDARLIAATLADSFPASLIKSRALLPAAMEIAMNCGLTVYDSLYLALAVARDAPLVTADRRMVETAGAAFAGLFVLME